MVKVYNLNEVIVDVVLTIEKHRIPMMFLDDILNGVKQEVELNQIIGRSEIGLAPEAHAKMLEQVGQDLEHIRFLSTPSGEEDRRQQDVFAGVPQSRSDR